MRSKWKKWEYVDKAIELDGWKLLLIMRFSPIIPYNLLNIAMATTSMSFWTVRPSLARGWGPGFGAGWVRSAAGVAQASGVAGQQLHAGLA